MWAESACDVFFLCFNWYMISFVKTIPTVNHFHILRKKWVFAYFEYRMYSKRKENGGDAGHGYFQNLTMFGYFSFISLFFVCLGS